MTELSPDPIAYGPTGIRCGCGKDAHSNLVPCTPTCTCIHPPEEDAGQLLHASYCLAANQPA